jgi:hypothetical protein
MRYGTAAALGFLLAIILTLYSPSHPFVMGILGGIGAATMIWMLT